MLIILSKGKYLPLAGELKTLRAKTSNGNIFKRNKIYIGRGNKKGLKKKDLFCKY